jgi:hypothetical protein
MLHGLLSASRKRRANAAAGRLRPALTERSGADRGWRPVAEFFLPACARLICGRAIGTRRADLEPDPVSVLPAVLA